MVLFGLLDVPSARAMSCVSVVYVDGRVLFGGQLERPERLPELGPRRRAVSPGCGEGEEDQWSTARTLRGVPADVAVSGGAGGSDVFRAEGSLVALADHPLHRATFGAEAGRTYRAGQDCRRENRAMQGTVAEDAASSGFRLRRADRTVTISIDARTKVTNRPVYQPLLERQRVSLRTSICGPRRVADRITFAGPTVLADADGPTRPEGTGFSLGRLALAGGILALVVSLLVFCRWAWVKTAP